MKHSPLRVEYEAFSLREYGRCCINAPLARGKKPYACLDRGFFVSGCRARLRIVPHGSSSTSQLVPAAISFRPTYFPSLIIKFMLKLPFYVVFSSRTRYIYAETRRGVGQDQPRPHRNGHRGRRMIPRLRSFLADHRRVRRVAVFWGTSSSSGCATSAVTTRKNDVAV